MDHSENINVMGGAFFMGGGEVPRFFHPSERGIHGNRFGQILIISNKAR